jgi:hypothetical protein
MKGSISLLVIVFGAIFFSVLVALSSYVLSQNRAEDTQRLKTQALAIAEAGLEYYRWHLAHFTNDLQNGTGHAGPYAVTIPDPQGGTAGTASLAIAANTSCGQAISIDITSTGSPSESAATQQTVVARYARPSVAMYSYIVNASVWAGADRVINGPYHSNGGVRMDGTANAPVTSSLSTWTCTSSFGCSPSATKPGVFGAGTNQDLWDYPTPQVDFAGIASNFSSLKTIAQSSGLYLPRYSSGNSNSSAYHKGYHLVFNADGTVTVWNVSSVTQSSVIPVNSSDSSKDFTLINNESRDRDYVIPTDCSLIFVEDNTWVEGVIPARITLVVANVTNSGVAPDAFLKGNISYAANDGSAGLTLISEHNILISPNSPQNMSIRGIFVAQGGAFGRNLYGTFNHSGNLTGCDSRYEPRGTLTLVGSTISNFRTGTQWVNGCGSGTNAGYLSRIDSFDRMLANNPPPFTPITSSDYKFVDWWQK